MNLVILSTIPLQTPLGLSLKTKEWGIIDNHVGDMRIPGTISVSGTILKFKLKFYTILAVGPDHWPV